MFWNVTSFWKNIPSRELTYPTWGKGKSSSKCHFLKCYKAYEKGTFKKASQLSANVSQDFLATWTFLTWSVEISQIWMRLWIQKTYTDLDCLCKKKNVSYTKPLLIIRPEHIRMYMYTFLNSVQRKLRKHTANYFQDVQKKHSVSHLKKTGTPLENSQHSAPLPHHYLQGGREVLHSMTTRGKCKH